MARIPPPELSAWPVEEVTITKNIKGTNNWTLLLDTEHGQRVLRLYRTPDRERITEEHLLLQALNRAQLPFAVPTPFPTTTGSTTTRLSWPDRTVLAALFPLLPGQPPMAGNPAHAAACGHALGHLHTAMARLPDSFRSSHAFPPINRVDPLVPDPANAEAKLDPGRTRSRQLAHVMENLMADDERAEIPPSQVIHADLFASNLLVHHDTVSAVLDFEYAGLGPTMMDVAIATLSICLTPPDRASRWELTRSLAAGYATVHPLPRSAAAHVPRLLRRREATSLINRIGRHRKGEITIGELRRRATRLIELDDWLTTNADQLTRSLTAPG
ncbi:MAG TPA: phosphotransferase [Mycobacteriales bacterium]|nr:phosphotransferase [Mycobacteriales bacterium]